ncbi:transposase [Embleya sp. NPDC127516]|uniref:IS110 family transposase n=1 Tax=Embleya sp. NPDC127516 TaxID=3363990 RepID=UPI003808E3ED
MPNDETDLLQLLGHGQRPLYTPGRTVHHASGACRDSGRTDAEDAFADQARMRRDLQARPDRDEIAVDLEIPRACRMGLAKNRTRAVNRLRARLPEFFPAAERAFDHSSSEAALSLPTGHRTPTAVCRIGRTRPTTWPKNRKVRTPAGVADLAVTAAEVRNTVVPGERTAAKTARTLAREVTALDDAIAEPEALRMFHLSARVADTCCPVSRAFYRRKRSEGKKHKHAVAAPARRRLKVLRSLIRDGRTFAASMPVPVAAAT